MERTTIYNSKNLVLLILLIAAFSATVILRYSESKSEKREKYEKFLHEKAAEMDLPSDEELSELPKPTHPNKAKLQDFFMTHDPETGIVPKERLMQAYNDVKNNASLKAISDVELEWQGTDAEMGGRTRAIMWDPNDP
jgi:hypothetical protein